MSNFSPPLSFKREGLNMCPSTSKKQQKYFGAELSRHRKGEKTKTHMTEKQLKDFARKRK